MAPSRLTIARTKGTTMYTISALQSRLQWIVREVFNTTDASYRQTLWAMYQVTDNALSELLASK